MPPPRDAECRPGSDAAAAEGTDGVPPAATSTSVTSGESLTEAFWMVARRLRHTMSAALAPWNLTPSQGRALMVLRRHGDLRAGALAEQLHVVPRSATEVIDGLEQLGLVARRPDPHDRRATVVQLTDQGERVVDAVATARSAQADALFADLTTQDRATLARILGHLRE